MEATLLVELLTEELPPKALKRLGEHLRDRLTEDLRGEGLLAEDSESRSLATPRRLAVSVTRVLDKAPDRPVEKLGPPVGAAAQAIAGFAKKNGADVASLAEVDTPKGRVVAVRQILAGSRLASVLASKVGAALASLPIPKLMRWGSGDAEFVRPVHGLVMIHGTEVVPGAVLGLESGRVTSGHRFMSSGAITLRSADEYERRMLDEGRVVVDFANRRRMIDEALRSAAAAQGAALGSYDDLLDEVTALVEHPSVYVAEFDPAFLAVPQECLILTMRQNQKYFPLFDATGRLTPRFLVVSNMALSDPKHVIAGNQRVIRPRLADARFFYEQDRRHRLESRVPALANVVHHNKLGTQLDRVLRVQQLAGELAEALGADRAKTERAVWLAKADLLSAMVGEFPELQGIMGRYYAAHDGEDAEVAAAVEAHYLPRFAGDALPAGRLASAVALADRLDTLAGLFGIGQTPTGDRDPFALRRAALGIVRILVENGFDLPVPVLVRSAFTRFPAAGAEAAKALEAFLVERLRGYLVDRGATALEAEAILCRPIERIDRLPQVLDALRSFQRMPESTSLAAANKRISNILRQADAPARPVDADLLSVAEEKQLATEFGRIRPSIEDAFEGGRYEDALRSLAALKAPVDAFFDKVMVMDKDERVRGNRIALLASLHATMNRVADLSKLVA